MPLASDSVQLAALRDRVRALLGALGCIAVFFFALACTKQQAGQVVAAGVTAVVDEGCQEIAGNLGLPPDVVAVVCPAAGEAGAQGVNLVLSRAAWDTIKARRADAGPGK